jgi:hypothetical protein
MGSGVWWLRGSRFSFPRNEHPHGADAFTDKVQEFGCKRLREDDGEISHWRVTAVDCAQRNLFPIHDDSGKLLLLEPRRRAGGLGEGGAVKTIGALDRAESNRDFEAGIARLVFPELADVEIPQVVEEPLRGLLVTEMGHVDHGAVQLP